MTRSFVRLDRLDRLDRLERLGGSVSLDPNDTEQVKLHP